jgi:hypothetical protein
VGSFEQDARLLATPLSKTLCAATATGVPDTERKRAAR